MIDGFILAGVFLVAGCSSFCVHFWYKVPGTFAAGIMLLGCAGLTVYAVV